MKLLLSLFLLLALVSCADDEPAPSNTPGMRMCIMQCGKSHDYCAESCTLDYRACYSDMQAAASRAYDNYARQRYQQHLFIDKAPGDFEHHERCDAEKKQCAGACDTPYNACYMSCVPTLK